MSVTTLPLSPVVNVTVLISPQAPATPTFNQGLIVGTSPVIGSVTGANPRIRRYTSLAQMASDGFALNSPEYVAASIYFSQPVPPLYLNIGRQDLTAIESVAIGAGSPTGYAVGDLVAVTESSASLGTVRVTAVTAGVPTAIEVVDGQRGTGYSISTNLATTAITGSGSGLEVNITAIGETPLQALQQCRIASPSWYVAVVLTATDADSIAIGEWAQAQTPQFVYFYTTSSAAALNGTTGNVFSVLKAGNFSRAFGVYSTTQSGLAPNNIYAAVAAMGVAMGLNTGLAGSYFTMKFKQLVGIATEPLSQSQINTIESNNGNCYLSFANSYEWIEQGRVADGQFFDEVLNLDMLASDIQFSCVDLFVSNPAIFQTDADQTQILNVVSAACARSAARGFISPGTWTGQRVLNLFPNTALPNGYRVQSDRYTAQSKSNRAARQAMPVYASIIESGAVHSITIGVYVQQ